MSKNSTEAATPEHVIPKWDHMVDVVVVGAGAAGLPAAVRARDLGASVMLIEANTDIGGHAILSGGRVALGGGTRLQAENNVMDSPDQVYLENTNPDHPMTRYNDRKVVRAFANATVEAFDFLEANGVKFVPAALCEMTNDGTMTRRIQIVETWPGGLDETINGGVGSGLVRPLEKSARKKGVKILLQHEMTRIVRENPLSGRVLGVTVTDLKNNKSVSIRANKAVVTCTGGSSSNVHIRTIFDPRLTDVYRAGGDPWSLQSGAAEQCGMAIGASLGATSSARPETMVTFTKAMWIGSKDGYVCWKPESPAFERAGASGFFVADHQNTIHVNQLGNRFFDETAQRYANMNAHTGEPIDPSNKHVYDYLSAAVSSAVINGPDGAERIGGPIWVIFDADAAKREGWNLEPPIVDIKGGYFYKADSLAELAGKISQNRFQKAPMAAATLLKTVARYNSFVDSGKDVDFDKPAPKYKIQTGPFYAAWGTPVLHDCLTGLRINEKAQVMDVFGQVIPGFYCAGECAGGLTLHGLGKGVGIGYIAGTYAAKDGVRP